MKKIISYFLLFFMVFGIFTPFTQLHAQSSDGGGDSKIEETSETVIAQPILDFSCGFRDMKGCLAWAGTESLNLSGKLLYVTGIFLNQSLQYTVTESYRIFDNKGVKDSWNVLRDLANIFFIFILLTIGITTILQIPSWDYKKMLRDLIIMALLVNFSFFFTQVVIDVSNVAALEIYSQLEITSECDTSARGASQKIDCLNYGFTGAFMNELKISSLFDNAKFNEIAESGSAGFHSDILMIGLFGSIFIIIAAFVLAITAVMFLVRAIVLVILLMLSPLAFAAFVLTKTRGYFTDWIKKLISNAFFAPIYLLLILLTLSVMREMKQDSGSNSFVEALISGDVSKGDIIINYAIIIGFMIAALIIAKNTSEKMGVYGYKWASGIVGRNTAGRLGRLLGKSARGLERVPYLGFATRPLTAPLKALGDYGASAKFGTEGKSYTEAFDASVDKKIKEAKKMEEEYGLGAKKRYGDRLQYVPFLTPASNKAAAAIKKEVEKEEARSKRQQSLESPKTPQRKKRKYTDKELRQELNATITPAITDVGNDADDSVSLNKIAALMVENNNIEFSERRAIQDLANKPDRSKDENRELSLLMTSQVNNLEHEEVGKIVDVLNNRADRKELDDSGLDERPFRDRAKKEAKNTRRHVKNIQKVYEKAAKDQGGGVQETQEQSGSSSLTRDDLRDVISDELDQRSQQ